MNVKEIKELVDLVARRGLAGLEIERAGFRIRIDGPARPSAVVARRGAALPSNDPSPLAEIATATMAQVASPVPVTVSLPPAPQPSAAETEGLHVITSPIVGTFYRAPSPEAEPFVKLGDEVEKGKTLCIVEAMKLMNEIESDVSGTIAAIYPQNGQPVEFGEKLFAVLVR
jgi:acetyl-CoA carboxylase biotin carboxyl carrier protein